MKKNLLFTLIVSILASCSTSNEVMSSKIFQKRKYTKGWYVNHSKKVDKSKTEDVPEFPEEVVANEIVITENSVEEKVIVEQETIIVSVNEEIVSMEELSLDPNVQDKSETIEVDEMETNEVLLSNTDPEFNSIEPIQKEKELENTSYNSSDVSLILMILLCLFLPPIAVGILRGWDSQEFLISLVLFLVFAGGLALFGALASLAGLAGIVYAFLILFDLI